MFATTATEWVIITLAIATAIVSLTLLVLT